jgi:cyclic dehypoxanthinyl futalosine synthase
MRLIGEAATQVLPFIPDPSDRRIPGEKAPAEDLLSLGMRADQLRRALYPGGIVTYTNTIQVACDLTTDGHILAALEQGVQRGATGAVLALTHALPLDAAELLLQTLRPRYPALWLEMRLPSSAIGATRLEASLRRMRAAGLDSIACEDTALLLHRAAHAAGMRTIVELPVLPHETPADRATKLAAIGRLQAETGGFIAIRVTAPADAVAHLSDELTAVEYLTAVAMARLALPNIPHVESSWRAQGLKLLQMTLRFGANDAGSSCLERTIARPGPDSPNEEDLRHVIRDAGLLPIERRPDYSAFLLS